MRLSACPSLLRQPVVGTWHRAIRPPFITTALAYAHTATLPGRFNPGSRTRPAFEVLYLTENQLVTLFEVAALVGFPLPNQYIANPNKPWTIANVDVQLQSVVNLCRVSQRKLIRTSVQELTGDWRGYALRNTAVKVFGPHWTNVPTQKLGSALFRTPGVEGFVIYSAKVPFNRNLVIFPQKLLPGSFVRFTDPVSGRILTIP